MERKVQATDRTKPPENCQGKADQLHELETAFGALNGDIDDNTGVDSGSEDEDGGGKRKRRGNGKRLRKINPRRWMALTTATTATTNLRMSFRRASLRRMRLKLIKTAWLSTIVRKR
jgi:hypothetical protein